MPENFFESSAYCYGMVAGVRLTLQKINERGLLRPEFVTLLIGELNEIPTLNERGRFRNDEGEVVFAWDQEIRNKMVNELIGE